MRERARGLRDIDVAKAYFREYHIPGLLAGVFLILLLVVLHLGMQTALILEIVGEELVSPFRTALIGLGTGYYLGESIHHKHTSVVAFHVGAFVTLLVLSFTTIGLSYSTTILVVAVFFALFMNISDVIEHDNIRTWFDYVARDGSRSLLAVVTIMQYGMSLLYWSNTTLSSFSLEGKILVGLILLVVSYLATQVTIWTNNWSSEE